MSLNSRSQVRNEKTFRIHKQQHTCFKQIYIYIYDCRGRDGSFSGCRKGNLRVDLPEEMTGKGSGAVSQMAAKRLLDVSVGWIADKPLDAAEHLAVAGHQAVVGFPGVTGQQAAAGLHGAGV